MSILEVKNLCKKYPGFELKNVSFTLESGKITGFIGKNGAGKSTTINSLLNFVHPDSGEINFFGKNFVGNEIEIKQKIGFVSGGINYYPSKKLKTITSVTKSFYNNWDDVAYRKYMEEFKLDENKTPNQLSDGMKVKYALALALSHNAELLILDEPTSGLDPVARDNLLDVFMAICEGGKTIFFSTHITSDLDKCADNIIYIQKGKILADSGICEFVDGYKTVNFAEDQINTENRSLLIGAKRSKKGMCAIVKSENAEKIGIDCQKADLESIMIHLEKEGE